MASPAFQARVLHGMGQPDDSRTALTKWRLIMANEKKRANAVVTMEQQDKRLVFNVLGAGKVELDLTKVHSDILERAAIHGLKQRISDAAALPCDTETGLPATALEKYENLSKLVEHYNSGTGEWNRTRVAGEGKGPNAAKTLTAIANVYKLADTDAAKVYVEKTAVKRGIEYSEALALWRSSDKIKEELARMAAATPSKVNADELLGELG